MGNKILYYKIIEILNINKILGGIIIYFKSKKKKILIIIK